MRSHRLVTLCGIGGVGKTRLALQCAEGGAGRFRDGVVLIELAPVRQPELVPTVAAEALGLADSSSRQRIEVVVDHLRDKQALLVVDNCEHVLEATAALLQAVLRAAPDVQVVATSRQQLGVPGEVVLPVDPLPLPAEGVVVHRDSIEAHPALDLFVRRAESSVPGFDLDAVDGTDLIAICHRLEGIPLALELAAVRLKVLSASQLRERLHKRLPVLTHGMTTSPPRQHTLRATIDWTYELCDPAEQQLWRTASAFPGGFTLTSIEAVTGVTGADEHALLEALTGLVDRSVLLRSDERGVVRFRMLETIREYGLELLDETGESAGVRERFLDWCQGLVADFSANWFTPRARTWFRRLRDEHLNLRAALELWSTDEDQVAVAQRVAADLWSYWIASSLPEGRLWLARVVAQPGDPVQWRRAMTTYGFVAALQGEQAEAGGILGTSLASAREADDRAGVAVATHLLGVSAFFAGDQELAHTLLSEAGDRYAQVEVHPGWLVSLHVHTGLMMVFDGASDGAAAQFEQGLALCREAGDRWLRGYVLFGLAFVAFERHDRPEALRLLRECLDDREEGDLLGSALALDLVAWTLAADGDGERSATVLGVASRLWGTFGQDLYGSAGWIERRRTCEHRARRAVGDRRFEAAYARGVALSRSGGFVSFLDGDARPARHGDRMERAARLTRREGQVARLVASGLSNRDIAARLTLSTRTVEGHVQQVLVKMAFTSRTQIAAWLAGGAEPAPDPVATR
ncbi:ATP-binding protein [Pseudonocardia broussonetiae]|uniref:LuxR family transcriptional regulator n=1 Tax=Pseudonocardia broussonetiae TaxID=2736640 RepID=A0A6M6JP19_9PSEU|nr:LuxR C-terminal-related transcriptional regulator [Pseudonocardia broussonetiae]QJY48051.1 LuxR family transcriptional regulator [Pseudonocardia broussonetiae]